MVIIGLTGGIGAGKSTIATFFKELDVPVYIADNEAKRLMHTSKVVKEKIINEFGEKAYIHNKLNRPFLAAIVFSDKSKYAYEISGYAHHHLICRKCGMEVEVPQVNAEALYTELQESTGFQLLQNHISFFGLCPACQKD